MRLYYKHFIFLLFCILPAHANAKVFNAKTTTLDNGMQVIVVENHRAPVVTHMVWYRAGAADEPYGKSGIAHFLEHLLFKGQNHPLSGKLEPGEFSRIVRRLGGEDNAFTSQDYTAYYQSITTEHLETVMKMEAGRMRGIVIPETDFESEKKVIQEERRQRTDNSPIALLYEEIRKSQYPNHAYGIPVIGWMHEILDLKLSDAMAFYDKFYAPNNAILIVSGGIKAEAVFELAQKTYGTLKPSDNTARPRTAIPRLNAKTQIIYPHESTSQVSVVKTFLAPSFTQNKRESLALEILTEIVGNGSTSRLYKELVINQKVFTDISMSYNSSALNDGSITISATAKSADSSPQALAVLEKMIDENLHKVVQNGIAEEELADAVKRLQAEAIYARDSLSGPAMIIGYSIMTGATLDDIENWPENLETVTVDDLKNVATLYLNPNQYTKNPPVIGFLIPKEKEKEKEAE
ncbi:MAG: insulinase family protein [Alphaproteobacteria bacterium]|nr:insulinase family protein [Alphaproteobacteria bacterium]